MSKEQGAGFTVSAVMMTVSLFISTGVSAATSNEATERYQLSESVSGTVYQSQSARPVVKRNIELVKPRGGALVPVTNTHSDEAAESDVSMLSFIDEWLGIEPVKPWEKGKLAKKEMKPGGVAPEFDVFSEKVFSYKQGSVGGSGVGGGGCGCN